MGDDRHRARSQPPGRPGKVLPSSPGSAGVAHDRNPGHHRRAGSPLSGTLAHSQRNNGSQRPQYPAVRHYLRSLDEQTTTEQINDALAAQGHLDDSSALAAAAGKRRIAAVDGEW